MGDKSKKSCRKIRELLPVFLFLAFWTAIALSAGTCYAAEARLVTVADGLPSAWITSLASTPEGKLWVGTGNAGIFLFDPDKGEVVKGYRASDGLSSDEVTSIALFQGKVWVGTPAGVSILDSGKWSTVLKADSVVLKNVKLAASPDGKELWACAVHLTGGIARFDGKDWKFMGGQGRGLFNDVQGFAFLPNGGLVTAAGSGGVFLHKGGDVSVLSGGLPPANGFAATMRRDIPVIATSQGVFEYEANRWKPVPLPEGAAGAPVFSIASRGDALFAGTRVALIKSLGNKTESIQEASGIPVTRVMALAVTKNFVVGGTSAGLLLVRGW